jgi:heptosyltransferase-2
VKILVIQTAFIGDVILTTPLFRTLKEGLAEAWVTAVVVPSCRDILEGNPHVDEIVAYDKRRDNRGVRGFCRILDRVRRGMFDLTVVPHRSLRSALLARLAGIPRRVGFDRSAGAFLFTDVVRYRTDAHEVDRNLDLVHPLGIEERNVQPEIFPGKADEEVVSSLLREVGCDDRYPLVAIAPGSVWSTKRWLPERFAGLADWLTTAYNATIVFVGGSGDVDLCQMIVEMMKGKGAISVAGRLSLRTSAALLARCHLLISNDSAPVHLASAVGTPTIALFGPTVPMFGFGPLAPRSAIVEVKGLPCRPCGTHGGNACPAGHFRCMRDLTVEMVRGEIEGVLQRDRSYTTVRFT